MAQELLDTAFQLIVVLIVALAFWLVSFSITTFIRKRAHASLFGYLGLYPPTPWAVVWAFAACLALVPASIGLFLLPGLQQTATDVNVLVGKVRESGLTPENIGAIVVMAFLKSALSEEILFRGLIGKRLNAWLGFGVGNVLQAAIFGSVQMLIFVPPDAPSFSLPVAAACFAVMAASGWVMGFLNERAGNGSIAPSWLLHGLSNAIAYPALAFL